MSQSKLWTKDFMMVAAINFIVYLVYYLLMVIIADFSMSHLGANPSQAGSAVGLFIVGALIARIISGNLVEKLGRKPLLYGGLLVYLAASFCYFRVNSLGFLFVIRFIHGAGFGAASVVTGTVVAQLIPFERRGEGIGYYSLSTTLASAIGPMLGMFLIRHLSFSAIIVLAIAVTILGLIAACLLNVPVVKTYANQERTAFSWNQLFEKKAVPISLIGAVLGIGYSSIISFLTSYTHKIDLVAAGSFFFIAYSLAVLLTRPVMGRLLDTKGENYVMYPAFIAFILGLFLMGQAHTSFVLLLAAVLIGAGFGTFLSSGQTIAIQQAQEQRIGLATSTFLAIVDAGVGIGPSILGALIPFVGYRGIYIDMALLVFFAGICYSVFNRRILHSAER